MDSEPGLNPRKCIQKITSPFLAIWPLLEASKNGAENVFTKTIVYLTTPKARGTIPA